MGRGAGAAAARWAALAIIMSVGAAAAGEARLDGQWRGVVTETNVGDYVTILDFRDNGAVGAVAYCRYPCGGTLRLIEGEDGTYIFSEKLTFGQDICVDDLTARVTVLSDDEIWFEELLEGEAALSGKLQRVNGPLEPNCGSGEMIRVSTPPLSEPVAQPEPAFRDQ